MDTITLLLFAVGLVFLVIGARLLVDGATGLATAIGISPLVVGLTVVALGTSSPELAVIVQSNLAGQPGVGVGNVVGSSVFNVLFILGLSALIAPLIVSPQLLERDGPVMVGAAILLLILAFDDRIGRLDGVLLVAILLAYTAYLIRRSRHDDQPGEETEAPRGRWILQLGNAIVGLVLLVLGSRWLVDGAVDLAEAVGLSAVVIGLTVVAIGTSLPEIAASLLASIRGQRDLAVGNVVGSNIFNVLAVLGLAALVSKDGIPVPPSAAAFDVPVAIAVAFACLLSFATGYEVARWEGALFLTYYVAYTVYLILDATDHAALPAYRIVVLPLAAAGLGLLVVRAVGARRRQALAGD